MTGTLPPSPAEVHPMLNLPPEQRIANAAAVLDGPHGAVSQRARQQGLSRQALYRDSQRLLRSLQELDHPPQRQPLRDPLDTLQHHLSELQALLEHAVVLEDDTLAAFAS